MKKHFQLSTYRSLPVLLCLASYLGAAAQQPPPDSSMPRPASGRWHVLVEPYIMIASLNGNVGIGTLPAGNINESPHDLLQHLQFGSMLYLEAHNDRWLFSSDLIYMKLSQDFSPRDIVLGGHADMKQLTWELAGLRELKPWFAAGIGLQLNTIRSDLNVTADEGSGPVSNGSSLSKTWVDPVLIAAIKMPLKHKLALRIRGDIGGFGIGSKVCWQLQGYVDYHLSKLFQVSAGYRAIKEDYEKGSDDDYFLYNTISFGPVIRVGFNF